MSSKKPIFKNLQKKLAKEHIDSLFKQQKENLGKDNALSQRYVDLIRKISMSFRLRLPREIKRSYCKHCYNVFTSTNSRVRVQRGKVIYFCNNCEKYTRIPYK